MTNRIGTAPHPTSGETYAVETLGLERADGVTIIRAAGPLVLGDVQDARVLLAMLDDARTNGTDQDDGNWLQEAWGDRNVRFTSRQHPHQHTDEARLGIQHPALRRRTLRDSPPG